MDTTRNTQQLLSAHPFARPPGQDATIVEGAPLGRFRGHRRLIGYRQLLRNDLILVWLWKKTTDSACFLNHCVPSGKLLHNYGKIHHV